MSPATPRAALETASPAVEHSRIRTLVHKRLPENVLLTDVRACSADHFVCAGRIPTDHPLFNDAGRTPKEDILFYTEVGRQASIALTHAFLDVGLDDVFIFEGSEAAVTDAIWRPPVHADEPLVVEIKVREMVRRKNNAVSRVVADYLLTIGGDVVFHGTGTWTIQPAALFRRLRRSSSEAASPAPADPFRATPEGSTDSAGPYPGNVVISAPEFRQDGDEVTASLIVDRTHPYFFDHPCDHVPGMLLLEGCAQLAQAALAELHAAASRRPAILTYIVDFTQFVEYDVPTTLSARLASGSRGTAGATLPIEIAISQRGVPAGTTRMTVGFSV